MKTQVILCAILFGHMATNAVSMSPNEDAGKTTIIPLEDIWAFQVPGSKNILDLESATKSTDWKSLSEEDREKIRRGKLWEPIVNSLMEASPQLGKKGKPRSGFAVSGTGLEALRGARSVLVDGKKPQESFPTGREISLVFFSYPAGGYHVRLDRVSLRAKELTLQYRLNPYFESNLSMGFALVPIGKLTPGKYQCKLTEVEMKKEWAELHHKLLDEEFSNRFVCKPFSFSVDMAERKEPK